MRNRKLEVHYTGESDRQGAGHNARFGEREGVNLQVIAINVFIVANMKALEMTGVLMRIFS